MSKVALIAATIIQQRLFDEKPNRDIIVNACCPGYIKTDMNQTKVQEHLNKVQIHRFIWQH